ncbi:hypothetical protein [Amycolatopsis sp. NPDC057786]
MADVRFCRRPVSSVTLVSCPDEKGTYPESVTGAKEDDGVITE